MLHLGAKLIALIFFDIFWKYKKQQQQEDGKKEGEEKTDKRKLYFVFLLIL